MDDAIRKGKPIPDRIANPPELSDELEFYLDAFFELNFDRPVGFGEGPIPTNAILSYSRHHGLDEEEEEDLLFFIRQIDAEYLEIRNKKSKAGKKK